MMSWVLFFVFLFAFFVLLFFLLRNQVLVKMGLRNVYRRKTHTVLVVFGLMIGTSILSSSFTIGDTMERMIQSEVLKNFFKIDEKIVGVTFNNEIGYFNESKFFEVKNRFDSSVIDGLAAAIYDYVAVLNLRTNLSEPRVVLIGVDFSHLSGFGDFVDLDDKKIKGLGRNELMIGCDTAELLDVKTGDQLVLYVNNTGFFFRVKNVLKPLERAGSGDGIYADLRDVQKILGKKDMINRILVSNKGGVIGGMRYTNVVKKEFNSLNLTDSLEYKLVDVKKDVLDASREDVRRFSDMFLVFGAFSVIAGVMLIMNIFVMLAEERKREMGISRAVGMRRRDLIKMYLMEGVVYAVFASLTGVFFGIGMGYVIIYFIQDILRSFGGDGVLSYFTFTVPSMLTCFMLGFLISVATIYVTSSRISRLNIVRAIRGLPEPKVEKTDIRLSVMGIGVVSTGLLFFALGVYFGKMVFFVSGISLVVIGLGLISRRWIGDRLAFSIVGLLVLFLWVLPSDWFPNYSVDVEMFIASGLFLVFSSLMLIMFNSESIVKGIIFLFSKFKTGRAVLKTAFRYSLHSKFRTGMMIAIFALVIFTITTMSMIVGILGANIENQVEKASGGYDIIGICNENSPVTDIREEIKNMVLNEKIKRISSPLSKRIALNLSSSQDGKKYYMVIGVDDEFIEGNQFEIIKLLQE